VTASQRSFSISAWPHVDGKVPRALRTAAGRICVQRNFVNIMQRLPVVRMTSTDARSLPAGGLLAILTSSCAEPLNQAGSYLLDHNRMF